MVTTITDIKGGVSAEDTRKLAEGQPTVTTTEVPESDQPAVQTTEVPAGTQVTQVNNPEPPASLTPDAKVVSGAMSGALVTIVMWFLSQYGLDVPGEVAAALTTLIGFLFMWITSRR